LKYFEICVLPLAGPPDIPTKTVLLPGSGVDLERHKLLEYPNSKKIKFLFVARIMKDKGIDVYLETAKAIKKKHLLHIIFYVNLV